jgi:hypothetical protein
MPRRYRSTTIQSVGDVAQDQELHSAAELIVNLTSLSIE